MKIYGVKPGTYWDMPTKAPKKNARREAKKQIKEELKSYQTKGD